MEDIYSNYRFDIFSLSSKTVEENEKIVREIGRFFSKQLSSHFTGFERHRLSKWNAEGYLPPSFKEVAGWKKFSIIDFLWLKLLDKMEGMGVPATLIQKASDYFLYFDVEKFFSKLLNEKGWSEHIEKIKRTEQVKALLKYSLIDLSRFSLLFFDILNGKTVSFLLGEELCEEIVIDRDEKKVDHDLSKKFHQIVSRLHTNFYCFSLNDLLKEIYIGPKSDLDYFENVSILSKEEAEIISALREAGLREVKVKLGKEGAIELLSKVSHLQIESVKRKVRGLSKKGTVNIMEMVYDEEENLRMAIKTEQIKFKKAKK